MKIKVEKSFSINNFIVFAMETLITVNPSYDWMAKELDNFVISFFGTSPNLQEKGFLK